MKRIVSCLLATILSLGLWTVPAGAANRVGSLDCSAFSADQSGEGWQWSQSTKTLTLDNLELTSDGDGIVLPSNARLHLLGSNSVDAQGAGLRAQDILFVEGSGSLDVVADGVGLESATLSFLTGAPLLRLQSGQTGVVLSGTLSVSGGAIHSQNGMQIGHLDSASVRENGGELRSHNGALRTASPVSVSKAYTVTVTVPNGLTVTGGGQYLYGESVSLNASPAEKLEGWSSGQVTLENQAQTGFIMPATNVSISAKAKTQARKVPLRFEAQEGGSVLNLNGSYDEDSVVRLEAKANAGYVFVGWTADSGTLEDSSAAVTNYTVGKRGCVIRASFAKLGAGITISATQGGSVTPGSGEYDAGTKLTLKATPLPGYEFVGWEATAGTLLSPKAQECIYEVPSSTAVVVAHFAEKSYSLRVSCEPVGAGTIHTEGGSYKKGEEISLSVSLKDPVNFIFLGWEAETGSFSDEKSSVTTFTMPEGDVSVKAVFANKVNALTVTATQGGRVLLETGEYVDHTTPFSENSRTGTRQTFVAEPLEGYYFTGWSVSEGELTDSASATLRFVMPTNPVVLTANFTKASYELSVVSTEGGSVNTSGGRKNLGASVELVATPKAGYRFAGWSVQCANPALEAGVILSPDSARTTMIMPACTCQVTAQFASLADGSIQTTASPSQGASTVVGSAPSVSTQEEDAPMEKDEGLPGWIILLGAVLLAALGVLLVIHRERRMRNGHVSVYKELFAKHNMKNLQKQETRRLQEQDRKEDEE